MAPEFSESVQHLPTVSSRSHVLVATRDWGSSVAATSSVHTPLRDPTGEIRLLRAVNKGMDDPLTYELRTVEFNPRHVFQAYYAISYTWGKNDDPRAITINGHDFVVSQNCYYALWQARLHYKNCSIWIDVICINQADLAEKSAQVAMMGEIYRQASCVLACVGPHADHSELMCSWVKRAEEMLEAKSNEIDIGSDSFAESCNEALQEMDSEQRILGAIRKFAWRAYWRRLWVVQELQLGISRTILIGENLLSWNSILPLGKIMWRPIPLPRDRSVLSSDPTDIELTSRLWRNGLFLAIVADPHRKDPRSMRLLLDDHYDFECEDPRDRIYGLLSLATEDCREELAPDYTITEFALALKLAKLMDLCDIPIVLKALNLSSRYDERGLWLEGQGNDYQLCDWGALPLVGDTRVLYELPSNWDSPRFNWVISHGVDGSVHLQASRLTYGEIFKRQVDSDYDFLYDWEAATQEYPGLVNTRRITSGTHIIGLICKEAQCEDLVVEYEGGLLLVLRRNSDQLYDIVGQGFVPRGYDISPTDLFSNEWLHDVEVWLSVGEAVALFASVRHRPALDTSKGILQDRIERFRYPVTAQPRGAARVQFQRKDTRDDMHTVPSDSFEEQTCAGGESLSSSGIPDTS